MVTLMRDELQSAQLLRALGYAPYGGSDIAECLAVAERVTSTSADLWYREWRELADRTHARAVASLQAGNGASARGGFWRAATYYRTAGLFDLQRPVSDRLREAHRREVESFRSGAALMRIPPQIVEIPSPDGPLPGYFFRASEGGAPRGTVILTNGYDGTAEELYFASGAALLERGYHVLTYDGPGQGAMILDRGVPFRPDWEAVVTPIVDWLLARDEVDPSRIALSGESFGGYLAPRAASAERRLAACLSDCGPVDLLAVTARRLPRVLAAQLPDGDPRLLRVLDRLLRGVMARPSAGWALRRGVLVHAVEGPLDYLRLAPQYSLAGRERDIACPTFVSSVEGDDLSDLARGLYERLTCVKTYVRFSRGEALGAHCEGGARSRYNQVALDWLAGVMPPVPAG